MFRLHPRTFMKLRDELMERDLIRDSHYVIATEKLTIFMYAMGHGVASGAMCEHFQHFSETIITKALASLHFNYIKLPSLTNPVHPRIRHDDRFYPYFKDAIGAIDGTHIPAHILREKQARYRNCKEVVNQNVMGVWGFDLIFQYVGVGLLTWLSSRGLWMKVLLSGLRIWKHCSICGSISWGKIPYPIISRTWQCTI
ncbi:hypothetical protein Taro_008347 [Colocasia esculenta]|uniref:DUF8040 domain-containing protein n=1 Tax=Colocasia esculenta TaxID=4460 RepID=A0A843U0T4_COLES|nr:hypothetical protein [Colocasia esculenta]